MDAAIGAICTKDWMDAMKPIEEPTWPMPEHSDLPVRQVPKRFIMTGITEEQSLDLVADEINRASLKLLDEMIPTEEPPTKEPPNEPRTKTNYVGAPAIFALEQACRDINDAFGGYGCYLVGSALERPGWRDVDVRFILQDEAFAALFPNASTEAALWEHDPRWLLLTVSISQWLSKITGLPVDFQFQPQTFANERHKGNRHAVGMRLRKPDR